MSRVVHYLPRSRRLWFTACGRNSNAVGKQQLDATVEAESVTCRKCLDRMARDEGAQRVQALALVEVFSKPDEQRAVCACAARSIEHGLAACSVAIGEVGAIALAPPTLMRAITKASEQLAIARALLAGHVKRLP